MSETLVLMKCQHCNYTWDYSGTNDFYVTCPKCRYKVRMSKETAQTLRKKRLDQESKIKTLKEQQPVKLLGIAGIVNKTVDAHKHDKTMLIQDLLDLQNSFGWLPRAMLSEISKQQEIPISNVYETATFYKAFSLAPRGKHVIKVCMGTSCKVRGADMIYDRIHRILGIERGETTPDGKFSLETVNCVGCCALGPTITIDEEFHGNLKVAQVKKVLSKYS
ncbi:MAG: NAD(P)H-dependent oxidoreductase subunit E [Candidatus Bathyarchaeia archaeon]